MLRKIEIYNFRSHKETIVELDKSNILIGVNNSGKTSFLDAISHAIGYPIKKQFTEEDFFADKKAFNHKKADPIKIILEFREGFDETERFPRGSDIEVVFEGIIQDDESLVDMKKGNEPIKFIRYVVEAKYNPEKNKIEDDRYFIDKDGNKIEKKKTTKKTDSFFPAFYLHTIREISRELGSKSSFFSKIKNTVDYSSSTEDLSKLFGQIENILFDDNEIFSKLKSKIEDFTKTIKLNNDDKVSFQAFEKENWKLLNNLNIYLNSSNKNINLPLDKHGMGVQNVITLLILEAYLEIVLPKEIENVYTSPILCIEEPESHLHPNAQRSILKQINQIKCQSIISTHSPYIADQSDVRNFILFKIENGISKTYKIPKHVKNFNFKYGLPEKAYTLNAYLKPEDILQIKRFIQYYNPDLLFSEYVILCEGDSERIFLENVSELYFNKSLSQLGINVVACQGKNYVPFLKILKSLVIPWIILSDSEDDTLKELEKNINELNYPDNYFESKVLKYTKGFDFEKALIDFYKADKIKSFLSLRFSDNDFDKTKNNIEFPLKFNGKTIQESDMTNDIFINYFIDKRGKPFCSFILSESIKDKKESLLPEIKKLFDLIKKEKNL